MSKSKPKVLGPYTPTLILHGGAGAISRANLPPELYGRYRRSLLQYLHDTRKMLESGRDALDAACYAVACMEDDELFNCGRGSVFTLAGTIEMEASVMVCSVDGADGSPGWVKRAAAVSLLTETRHPILLAKELLLEAGDGVQGYPRSMHVHLTGRQVEQWGWTDRGLERKDRDWFWTKRRWEEHLRDLQSAEQVTIGGGVDGIREEMANEENRGRTSLPSQGTVGAVCMDSWGNLAVATSTGGLTNKKVGRTGDTPTVGSGYWAESWDQARWGDEDERKQVKRSWTSRISDALQAGFGDVLQDCLFQRRPSDYIALPSDPLLIQPSDKKLRPRRRAVAMSGTGNGDSFLRTNATRTAAAMCRFGPRGVSLEEAVTAVAGVDGELQRSAGDRWMRTGEGQGGIIGIELDGESRTGKIVFDFNCGGLWRAWIDGKTGQERIMVFRDEYEDTIIDQ